MKLFLDRTHRRNVWYVIKNGTFIAGPFLKKGEAIQWFREMKNEHADS